MWEPRRREREGGRKREGKGRRDGEEGGEEERRNERGHGELMRPRLSPGRGQCESQRSREAWHKVEKAVFKTRDSVGRGTGPEEQMANGWDWRLGLERDWCFGKHPGKPLRTLDSNPWAHGVRVTPAAVFPSALCLPYLHSWVQDKESGCLPHTHPHPLLEKEP